MDGEARAVQVRRLTQLLDGIQAELQAIVKHPTGCAGPNVANVAEAAGILTALGLGPQADRLKAACEDLLSRTVGEVFSRSAVSDDERAWIEAAIDPIPNPDVSPEVLADRALVTVGYAVQLLDLAGEVRKLVVSQSLPPLSKPTASDAEADPPKGFLGGEELADVLGVHATRRTAFIKKLERERKRHLGEDWWHEAPNPRPNSPHYLYLADSAKVRELAGAYKNPKPA